MTAHCLDQFIGHLDQIAEIVSGLRRRFPKRHLLVAMEVPSLTLLPEPRRYPVSFAVLHQPDLRNILAVLDKLAAGSIVALYPSS